MRILSWNCRGVGRAPTVRALKALVWYKGSDVLFVAETKVKSPKIDMLKRGMGFPFCFCVDSVGKSGGLALFWKMGVELEVVYFDNNLIVALVYSDLPENA